MSFTFSFAVETFMEVVKLSAAMVLQREWKIWKDFWTNWKKMNNKLKFLP